ncbi:twin-arginine translocation signal domain-containing protein [Streptomyces sp. NPDC097610]|uniref:twin-arginine translocation signal domain-containing protein n=1 Tax=Streptomyces sp. NPDC097610 TaxID=3157227 RepID=UPI0033205681
MGNTCTSFSRRRFLAASAATGLGAAVGPARQGLRGRAPGREGHFTIPADLARERRMRCEVRVK